MKQKICPGCKKAKPLTKEYYYRNRSMKDGFMRLCKDCHNVYCDDYKNRNPHIHRMVDKNYSQNNRVKINEKMRRLRTKWKIERPETISARSKTSTAIKNGSLIREGCLVCGEKSQAHHEDYFKPLDIVWLCRHHHKLRHRWLWLDLTAELEGEKDE